MKGIFIKKFGTPKEAFSIEETNPMPLNPDELRIQVKSFGLNYADVMARKGLYPEMPKMPCIIGYDVYGHISEVGANVEGFALGDQVVALTRFGGYQEEVVVNPMAVLKLEESMQPHVALSLTTQLITAYFSAIEQAHIAKGQTVLIHAAAGGVGQGLVQLCKHIGCRVIAVASSDSKIQELQNLGANICINRSQVEVFEEIKKLKLHGQIDAIFDSVGGGISRKGFKSLKAGGKLVLFGFSKLSGVHKLKALVEMISFGLYHPLNFMMNSKGIIGVNMLKVADENPEAIQRCLRSVYELYKLGVFSKIYGQTIAISEFNTFHELLEQSKTQGKIAVSWT
ncbi:MAG: zinc-binding dehydrogenase [Chitinophagales bacterium]|jgi:NADPH2:quinone reductase|nr:zinc-binding dehydrogenase [Chitinophagales bacterium]